MVYLNFRAVKDEGLSADRQELNTSYKKDEIDIQNRRYICMDV
jgi:hypothetical protein